MSSLFAALGLVFLAELGDKTQLVALGFGARHRLAPVLTGVVIAYAATNLLSVVVGALLGEAFPTQAIGLVGGVLFLGFAVWTLRSGDEHDDEPGLADLVGGEGKHAGDDPAGGDPAGGNLAGGHMVDPDRSAPDRATSGTAEPVRTGGTAHERGRPVVSPRSIVVTVAAAMFVAELGDKTMLATATLAAQGNPVLTWVGATIGIILSGALGVVLGRAFGARLSERATRIGSAALFAVFGLVLIATNL